MAEERRLPIVYYNWLTIIGLYIASVSLMLIYEIRNSKILNHWMIADNFALMQQLGVIQ